MARAAAGNCARSSSGSRPNNTPRGRGQVRGALTIQIREQLQMPSALAAGAAATAASPHRGDVHALSRLRKLAGHQRDVHRTEQRHPAALWTNRRRRSRRAGSQTTGLFAEEHRSRCQRWCRSSPSPLRARRCRCRSPPSCCRRPRRDTTTSPVKPYRCASSGFQHARPPCRATRSAAGNRTKLPDRWLHDHLFRPRAFANVHQGRCRRSVAVLHEIVARQPEIQVIVKLAAGRGAGACRNSRARGVSARGFFGCGVPGQERSSPARRITAAVPPRISWSTRRIQAPCWCRTKVWQGG